MIFKKIYLYPELSDYGKEITFPFKEQTRSLCNYLERFIKKDKFQRENYKRVCFIGRRTPKSQNYVNSCNVLEVDFFFDETVYLNTPKENLNEYFVNLFISGLNSTNDVFNLPKERLIEGINQFKKENYNNIWVFKKKKIKKDINCQLVCKLTLDNFFLFLSIDRNKENIFEKVIVTDVPNEFVFNYHLKDLEISKDSINVVNKRGDVIYEKDLFSFNHV